MSRAVAYGVKLGDLMDGVFSAFRAAPGGVLRALAARRARGIGVATGVAYLLIYLVTLGDIDVSTSGRYGRFVDVPSLQVVPQWSEKLFAERAPFLYEPVVAIYPLPQLAIFVSVGNLLLGSLLALLLALNVAVAVEAVRERACRPRSAYAGVFGALPGFLMGFSCCVPTFLLVLGANFAAALVPVRSYLFPLAVGLMALTLVWGGRGLRRAEAALASPLAAGRAPGVRDDSAQDALTVR